MRGRDRGGGVSAFANREARRGHHRPASHGDSGHYRANRCGCLFLCGHDELSTVAVVSFCSRDELARKRPAVESRRCRSSSHEPLRLRVFVVVMKCQPLRLCVSLVVMNYQPLRLCVAVFVVNLPGQERPSSHGNLGTCLRDTNPEPRLLPLTLLVQSNLNDPSPIKS